METILITGSHGQLGNEMQQAAVRFPQFNFIYTDVEELDICDKAALDAFVKAHAVNVIVNCAAYTAVDKAEDDVELCYKINSDAVRNIGEVAAVNNLKVVQVSTDYVFDGTNHLPYTEDEPVCPATVYGKSKLAGEQALMETCQQAVIIRTSWLYSSFGNNFVKTILRNAGEKPMLRVVFDQTGSPTYAADLAEAIMFIISGVIRNHFALKAGIYNYTNEGVCTWHDFATEIVNEAGLECAVNPVLTKDYKQVAERPAYSVMDKSKIKENYGLAIPHWRTSLKICLKLLS